MGVLGRWKGKAKRFIIGDGSSNDRLLDNILGDRLLDDMSLDDRSLDDRYLATEF